MTDEGFPVSPASNDNLQSTTTASTGSEANVGVVSSPNYKIKDVFFLIIRQGAHHQNSAYERMVAIDSNGSLYGSCWTLGDNLQEPHILRNWSLSQITFRFNDVVWAWVGVIYIFNF